MLLISALEKSLRFLYYFMNKHRFETTELFRNCTQFLAIKCNIFLYPLSWNLTQLFQKIGTLFYCPTPSICEAAKLRLNLYLAFCQTMLNIVDEIPNRLSQYVIWFHNILFFNLQYCLPFLINPCLLEILKESNLMAINLVFLVAIRFYHVV